MNHFFQSPHNIYLRFVNFIKELVCLRMFALILSVYSFYDSFCFYPTFIVNLNRKINDILINYSTYILFHKLVRTKVNIENEPVWDFLLFLFFFRAMKFNYHK